MIKITGIAHIGVRVANFKRSIQFYEELGFHLVRNDPQERVVVIQHPSGVEINFLDSVNFDHDGRNVLMDETVRYPGFTHLALSTSNVYQAAQTIRALGIRITEGPVTFGDGSTSIFFRDPDRNVIELSQPNQEYLARRHSVNEQQKEMES